ncbi:hypothetical protein HZA56_07685 [Candidatus Poribacteria bacterium]|nr:hypothetical protein [Candidatus Poribacteria bacterium]
MRLSRMISRFVTSFTLAGLALTLGSGLCFADACCHHANERCAPSGHVVGDTIARGINFAFNPVYQCLSNAAFKVCKPPASRLITTITIQEPPEQQQPQAESVE